MFFSEPDAVEVSSSASQKTLIYVLMLLSIVLGVFPDLLHFL
jgi:hypothetical protein